MKEEKYIRKRVFSKNDKTEVKSDRKSDQICNPVSKNGFAFKVPCTIFISWSIGNDLTSIFVQSYLYRHDL